MPNTNKLSIYLIKDEFAENDEDIIKSGSVLLGELDDLGKVYYNPSQVTPPKWVESFFCNKLESGKMFTSNVRAVLIARVKIDDKCKKTFAIVMGYGKYLLVDDVIENDFGLKVVLNTITPNSLRKINKTNIGGNQKTSNEQLPLASDIDDFGFDIDRDLIGNITGRSDDDVIATGMMTGGDLLSLSAQVDVTNLADFLKRVYKRYISVEYKKYFGWVDNIRRVKDPKLIGYLEKETVHLINEQSPNVWMAVPDVLEWEKIDGFKYAGRQTYPDLDISIFKDSFKDGLKRFDQIKQKTVRAIDACDGESLYMSWAAHKCLYAELEYEGKVYCISKGQWFCVEKDFVKTVNDIYESIPISDMSFLEHPNEKLKESEYTRRFVKSAPDKLLCMDQKTIMYGGGQSKIELCDVLTVDKKFIHIKPYTGSATLSHLFSQSVVSAELILGDGEFRRKANDKIKENSGDNRFYVEEGTRPDIVLAIISKEDCERPKLPFFSKVALRYTKRRLDALKCNLAIKNIRKPDGISE